MKNNQKVFWNIRLILLVAIIFAVGALTPRSSVSPQVAQTSSALLKVDFLDVGQADSILIQTPGGKNLLIDAGNNNDFPFIRSYLKEKEINHLDAVIGTHPHEDHIGSLDAVITEYSIGAVYLPKITSNTKTFRDLLLAIKSKGLSIKTARASLELDLDPAVNITFLAPKDHAYEDINDYSAVVKITYGATSFLFTGDAETVSEWEMVQSGQDLRADVLKVGHHGSRSSSSIAFLAEVAPKFGVISVGEGNKYGHPAPETIARLAADDIQVFRTDTDGTVRLTSDGRQISLIQDQKLPQGWDE